MPNVDNYDPLAPKQDNSVFDTIPRRETEGCMAVEDALDELREMWPESQSILVGAEWTPKSLLCAIEIAGAVAIERVTLADCVEVARAWKAQQ